MVAGTRPDAIKSAPVALELRRHADSVDLLLISTGQHREMLAQALGAFGLRPDVDLGIMRHGQTLSEVTCGALAGLDDLMQRRKPDYASAVKPKRSCFA